MGTLVMKPEEMISHFQNKVTMANIAVGSSESDTTRHVHVEESYTLPGNLVATASYDSAAARAKIVLKQQQLKTIVMTGSLDDFALMLDAGRQWFVLHPGAASVVGIASEEALLQHYHALIADLRPYLTWLTMEYQLLNHARQPKITVDYGPTYGGWGDSGHGRQTPYYQASSSRELLQKVIPALDMLVVDR